MLLDPKWRSSGPAVVSGLRKSLLSYYCITVAFKSHIECINISGTSDIASITYDGRSGMNVIAFRIAPQIDGFSCSPSVTV